jgi:hypothetical protein
MNALKIVQLSKGRIQRKTWCMGPYAAGIFSTVKKFLNFVEKYVVPYADN